MASESGATAAAQLVINLDADSVTGSAETAAQALEQLRTSIKSDTSELAHMQRALKNLEGGTKVSIKQVYALKDAIASKKSSIADAQSRFIKVGGSFRDMSKQAKPAGDQFVALQKKLEGMKKGAGGDVGGKSLEDFGKQASKLPGPLGDMLGKLGDIKSLIAGGDLGFLGLAAGLTALVAATVAAIAKLTQYGIAQADARRSELLRMEGLTKMRFWYGAAAGNAKEMQDQIDRVAASSATGRSEIAKYGNELYMMGLRGENWNQALEGMAIKSSVMGDASAHAFAGWAAGAALTGQSVKHLTDTVKTRMGGTAQKQMQSLTVQTLKAKESMDALTSGLNVDKYVKASKEVNDLLSQTTASGRALKSLFTQLVQPLIDMTTQAQPYIKRFFQGMIQMALKLHIQWLTLKIAFKKTFHLTQGIEGIDKMNAAAETGKVVFWALGAALAFATGWMIAFTWPVLLVGAALWGLWEIVDNLYKLWVEIDWADLGKSMLDGIIEGFNGDYLVQAIKGEITAVIDSVKGLLGISSPSKVFAQIGLAVPEGFATGVDAGAPTARSAIDDMVDVPRIPATDAGASAQGAPPVAGKAGASSGAVFNFGDINIGKSKDAKAMAMDFKRELEHVLEGVVIQFGAPSVGEPT